MKCRCSGSNKVRMGEKLASDILIGIKDKHGNDIKKVGIDEYIFASIGAISHLKTTEGNVVLFSFFFFSLKPV